MGCDVHDFNYASITVVICDLIVLHVQFFAEVLSKFSKNLWSYFFKPPSNVPNRGVSVTLGQ